jgi:hypothetical protein
MVLTYVSENDSILRRRDFDVRLDVAEIMWSEHNRLRTFNELQVSNSRQFQSAVLQCVTCKRNEYARKIHPFHNLLV